MSALEKKESPGLGNVYTACWDNGYEAGLKHSLTQLAALRKENAEFRQANIELRAEIENLKIMWKETIDNNTALRSRAELLEGLMKEAERLLNEAVVANSISGNFSESLGKKVGGAWGINSRLARDISAFFAKALEGK